MIDVHDGLTQSSDARGRVLMLGATGTIGRATARALVARSYSVTCFVRPGTVPISGALGAPNGAVRGVSFREGDVLDPGSIARDGLRGEHFDAIVSCMASRTGTPRDAWAVDYQAHVNVLAAAKSADVPKMVLLSAICVQKPLLPFQKAKFAFERELMASGLKWSIVRPTAFFKSLSGQLARVKRGKPYLIFGDGNLTSCKPISDDDLANFLIDCIDDPAMQNRILPIGGPGDALTPRQQATELFGLLGMEPKFRSVPVALLDVIIGALSVLGEVVPSLQDKAHLARIGRYYATESMLVWDSNRQCYDGPATPSTGTDTLIEYQARLLRGEAQGDLGDHAVFS